MLDRSNEHVAPLNGRHAPSPSGPAAWPFIGARIAAATRGGHPATRKVFENRERLTRTLHVPLMRVDRWLDGHGHVSFVPSGMRKLGTGATVTERAMESFPLFIVGSPRSGTTFFRSVLNAHPLIHLTNECRIFALLKEFLDVGCHRPDLLGESCRDAFSAFSRRTLGAWVERFYREELKLGAPIWGDKHPAYAAPTVLSGRTGSIERLPRSGSCLRLIRELLPQARFIHLHRDPRSAARGQFVAAQTLERIDRRRHSRLGTVRRRDQRILRGDSGGNDTDGAVSNGDRRAGGDSSAPGRISRARRCVADQRLPHFATPVADTVQRSRHRHRRSLRDSRRTRERRSASRSGGHGGKTARLCGRVTMRAQAMQRGLSANSGQPAYRRRSAQRRA